MDVGTPGTRMADYLRDHHDKVIGRWTDLVVAGARGRTTADEARRVHERMTADLAAFNKLIRDENVPAVQVPSKGRAQ